MNEQINPVDNTPALHENFIEPPTREGQPYFEKSVRRSLKRESITTINLTSSTCRWPFGDPAKPDFHYCGQPSQTDRPYCDTHEAISRPSGQRKNRAQAA
jgi:hypothetical protein